MKYEGPLNTIVLTNITNDHSIDVICFHSAVSWSAFRDYAIKMGVSYVFLTPSDAAKILYQLGGVGYGCYTMHGVSSNYTKEKEYRQALAAMKKRDIGSVTGICSIASALRLDVDPEDGLEAPRSESLSVSV